MWCSVTKGRIFGRSEPVEHLADLVVNHLCVDEPRATSRARRGRVDDDLVGILHLGEMLALSTGLLALATTLCAALRTVRLGQPLLGGRHRRVARRAAETLLQVGEACLQLGDLGAKRCVLGLQSSDVLVACVVLHHMHQCSRPALKSRAP